MVKIIDVIGSCFAVSPEDGEKIFEQVKDSIKQSKKTIIDFDGIDLVTTAFLNTAIGKLYTEFTSDELNQFLILDNVSFSDMELIRKVIQRAKISVEKNVDLSEELGDE